MMGGDFGLVTLTLSSKYLISFFGTTVVPYIEHVHFVTIATTWLQKEHNDEKSKIKMNIPYLKIIEKILFFALRIRELSDPKNADVEKIVMKIFEEEIEEGLIYGLPFNDVISFFKELLKDSGEIEKLFKPISVEKVEGVATISTPEIIKGNVSVTSLESNRDNSSKLEKKGKKGLLWGRYKPKRHLGGSGDVTVVKEKEYIGFDTLRSIDNDFYNKLGNIINATMNKLNVNGTWNDISKDIITLYAIHFYEKEIEKVLDIHNNLIMNNLREYESGNKTVESVLSDVEKQMNQLVHKSLVMEQIKKDVFTFKGGKYKGKKLKSRKGKSKSRNGKSKSRKGKSKSRNGKKSKTRKRKSK
tara:strand:- start:74 stop:1147 length:1074 start_codon:yes stop_codon:yes gene_type:complete